MFWGFFLFSHLGGRLRLFNFPESRTFATIKLFIYYG